MKINSNNQNVVIFNCSPSLGILDNWLPVIYELRNKLPKTKFIFLAPTPDIIEQIDNNSTLVRVSLHVFDQIVFYSHCAAWIKSNNFDEAKRINKISKFELLLFVKRVFKKLHMRYGVKLLDCLLKYIANYLFKQSMFHFQAIDSSSAIVLFDLHEINKAYNKTFFEYFNKSYKFSILHGININGFRSNEKKVFTLEPVNTIAYIFSEKERKFYQEKYLLHDLAIRSYGIPRHEKKWIDFLLMQEGNQSIPFNGDYIFIISRAVGETLLLERKLEYIKEIKKISELYKCKVVIKLHPKEIQDNTFDNILGSENYGKTWCYSSAHPYFLGKYCKFAISFYSGVPIDMIMLGTPTIERLNLGGIQKYDLQTTLIDDLTGEPITEYRYFGLVLGASTYEQMLYHVEQIYQNREIVLRQLQNKYLEIFSYTDNINNIISDEIYKTIEQE